MKRYDLSREAQHNLKGIRKYTKDHWGDKQAKIYLFQLQEQMRQLAEMPTST